MSELSTPSAVPARQLETTPLAMNLRAVHPHLPLASCRGAETVPVFTDAKQELTALTTRAGVYDLGYRAFAKITGGDRIRWLNGMVTNTIVGLNEGQGNYSFLLNAQGRILGDATIYRFSDHLLLETDRSQLAAIVAHLDHFIIMDDVELQPLDASATAIGVAGPGASDLLSALQLPVPQENACVPSKWASTDVLVAHSRSPYVPTFEIQLPAAAASELWAALLAAGAEACGAESVEALRILEGTPLYGRDIGDRHLPQETAQAHALNFSKGCYLGQEIVERIRSRATVHRTFKQFSLSQSIPFLEAGQTVPIEADGAAQNPVGQLSSVAEYDLPGFRGTLGLGFIRAEVLERKLPLTAAGIAVTALDAPPKITNN